MVVEMRLRIFVGLAILFNALCIKAQTVTNGSVTGAPAANNGITSGNAPGWSTFAFSPDLCNVAFPSYSGNSQVPRIASPDGGTWLGIASLGESAQTTITGLTIGQTYILRFCGANFGTGALYNGTPANPTIAVVGVATTTLSIPQVANTWNPYSLTFTATATSHILRCTISGGSTYASLDGFNLTGALCNPVILPAEFINFEGRFEECKVRLTWESPSSETARDFEIQRSADGELFETLEKLDAAENHKGQWVDPFPLASAFYRIRMYNETGRVAESPILSIGGECSEPKIIVLGNPVIGRDRVSLKFTAASSNLTIEIRDMQGRALSSYTVQCKQGTWNDLEISVKALTPGVYLISTNEGAETKLLIQ